jgi:hypothetical protein
VCLGKGHVYGTATGSTDSVLARSTRNRRGRNMVRADENRGVSMSPTMPDWKPLTEREHKMLRVIVKAKDFLTGKQTSRPQFQDVMGDIMTIIREMEEYL